MSQISKVIPFNLLPILYIQSHTRNGHIGKKCHSCQKDGVFIEWSSAVLLSDGDCHKTKVRFFFVKGQINNQYVTTEH